MARLTDDALRLVVLRALEEQVLRETRNRFERLLLLDGDGTLLFSKDGSGRDVFMEQEELEQFVGRVHLLTHNHPRGTSLTEDDLLGVIDYVLEQR